MATVPTPEVSLAVLVRSNESLIEPPQPVIRAECVVDESAPKAPREAAVTYSRGHRSDAVDPDNPDGSGDSADREESAEGETSEDVGSLWGGETESTPEVEAVEQGEFHQINLFA
ncbi:MAG: hypothetical protein ACP5E5_10045 [Acidobacteriaceae bacterium]